MTDESTTGANRQQPRATLNDVNDDCNIHIMSYLPTEDLNTLAVCSWHYRELRDDASFDHRRSGTILVSQQTSPDAIAYTITKFGGNDLFTGYRTILRVVGRQPTRAAFPLKEEEMVGPCNLFYHRSYSLQLMEVTSVDLLWYSLGNFSRQEYIQSLENTVWQLATILPNLLEVNVSGVVLTLELVEYFLNNCPYLRRMTCSVDGLSLDGSDFNEVGLELYLDGSKFVNKGMESRNDRHEYSDGASFNDAEDYMFIKCPHLERLSVKNVTIGTPPKRLEQDVLVKLARNHPTLHWLRSDLPRDVTDILKLERPDMTFA